MYEERQGRGQTLGTLTPPAELHLGVIVMVLSALAAAIHLVLPGLASFTFFTHGRRRRVGDDVPALFTSREVSPRRYEPVELEIDDPHFSEGAGGYTEALRVA